VFVDGAFWHGHPSAFTPGKSGAYWDEKINGNVRRDREADATLVAMGWIVLRLWDFEISQQLERCIERVEAALSAAQQRQEPNPQSRIGGLRAEEAHG
jgi:DNA mismatch endonuclease, patch repair protein